MTEPVIVRLKTTAVAPVAGTPPTPSTVRSTTADGAGRPAGAPIPRRVSITLAGDSGTNLAADPTGSAAAASDVPYPIKVWVNGHEWAKRQATAAGIGFTALSNGFATCDDPTGLQEICDRLGRARSGSSSNGG